MVAFGFLPENFGRRWGPTGKVKPKYLNDKKGTNIYLRVPSDPGTVIPE